MCRRERCVSTSLSLNFLSRAREGVYVRLRYLYITEGIASVYFPSALYRRMNRGSWWTVSPTLVFLFESAGCDSPWQIVSAYRFLQEKFQDNRPDVVQTFLHHANIVGVHAARSAGVKTRVAGVRVAQNHQYRNILEKRSLRHVNHTLCVSQAVETFTHRVLGCDPSKTSVIPNLGWIWNDLRMPNP